FFFQAEDGIRYLVVTGVQTCALPISGYALLLLLLAIATGYLILAPSDLRATPLARPLPEPRPGLVTDRMTPTGHVEPTRTRRSWPRTVTGKVLDSHRQPLAGAGIVLDGKE